MKSDKRLYLLVLPAFVGGLLVILSAIKYGPAISTDSVAYIYAAEHFSKGEGFVYFGYSTPFIQWPPLYPLIIGLLSLIGINSISAALYLNVSVFGLIIFFSGFWLYKNVSRFEFAIIGSFIVLLSIPLYRVLKFAWSESIFILFIILFFISLEQFVFSGRYFYLFLTVLFTSLACLTRYTGVVLILTGITGIAFQRKKTYRRFIEMLFFGAASSLPLILWIIRNYIVSNTFMGARTASNYSMTENIKFLLKTVLSWFMPEEALSIIENFIGIRISRGLLLLIFAIFIIIICSGLVYTLINGLKKHKKAEEPGLFCVICPLVFIIIYISNLIISATSVAFDAIDSRLMSPIFAPILFLIILSVDRLVRSNDLDKAKLRKIIQHISLWGLNVCLILWISLSATSIFGDLKASFRSGSGGFATDKWYNSPTIKYLKDNPLYLSDYSIKYSIVSNCPDAVYYHTQMPVRYPPRKNSLPEYGIMNFEEALEENEDVFIIWFDTASSDLAYNVEELSQAYEVKRVLELEDSSIYRVKG